ncbi:GNAT family N-acetyltransferase [Nocardioides sp. YIM 152315]|uniref:GNAT family N-acetyltransferase n=1 Tax=Nocardioides sp. YIM 152315 TaxID=3031760 RepID=UPI0023D984C1|nr:GNAT family N-acetyltransferase [Nocardioides sp. YIM 152315]MDF1602703.1 GNAT family N-acetyltransferase [Nocardioides sp. YIM 152315]
MTDLVIRPMTVDDVPEAERISDEGFFELDTRMRRTAGPAPERRSETHRAVWIERTRHLVRTDPGGCWVAEDDTGIVGIATSFRREVLWCLATYAVLPGRQGRGIGKPLLAAAMNHGRSCTRWMLAASADTKAVRIYHQVGFELHPQMHLTGTVDRSALPAIEKVREGSAGDVELMDSLDRGARGAGHGPDHELMLRTWRLLVSDTSTGSGYAYLDERGRLALLAASNRRTATRLLWAALAEAPERASVGHVTGANQWVLDVGLAARLELHQEGYLGLRGMKPPAPYVHHGALL